MSRCRILVIMAPSIIEKLIASPAWEHLNSLGDVKVSPVGSEMDVGCSCYKADVVLLSWGSPRMLPGMYGSPKVIGVVAGTPRPYVDASAFMPETVVVHAADAIGPSVAEHAFLLILDGLRDHSFRQRRGITNVKQIEGHRRLAGLNVGLVGFGASGRAICKLLSAAEANVLVFDPYVSDKVILDKGAIPFRRIAELFQNSQVISLHCALNSETRNLVDSTLLNMASKNLVLVNTSRGEVLDENALFTWLYSHREARCLLDVTCQEPYPENNQLSKLENLVMTHHVAGPLLEDIPKLFGEVVKQCAFVLNGHPHSGITNPADLLLMSEV